MEGPDNGTWVPVAPAVQRDSRRRPVRKANEVGSVRCGPEGRMARPPGAHDPEWS